MWATRQCDGLGIEQRGVALAETITQQERRRYRKVYPRLWSNQVFQDLTDAQKVMTLYLLSGPQTNRIGLFRFSVGEAGEDLRVPVATVIRRVDQVCQAFAWAFDPIARVIWIPSWWSFNPPAEKVNNFKGALRDLSEVPRTSLIAAFCRNTVGVPEALHPLLKAWTPSEQCSDTVVTQEQEQEQEQENGSSEPLRDSEPPLLVFDTVGGGRTWGLSRTLIEAWQQAYPNVDVLGECRKAHAWIVANPGRRKTPKGMPKFLVNWLSRAVNRGGSAWGGPGATRLPGTVPTVTDADRRPWWQRDCQHEPICTSPHEHRQRLKEAS